MGVPIAAPVEAGCSYCAPEDERLQLKFLFVSLASSKSKNLVPIWIFEESTYSSVILLLRVGLYVLSMNTDFRNIFNCLSHRYITDIYS